MSEDRGVHHRVFSQSMSGGREASFGSFPAADRIDVVSVPIGWALSPCPARGVVLRSLFGEEVDPFGALVLAAIPARGFRHVRTEHVEFE